MVKTQVQSAECRVQNGEPEFALSIRQPWAWLIAHGYKPGENRTWRTAQRGPVYIHAGATMTRADYEACVIFVNGLDIEPIMDFPSYKDLLRERGGIVGRCEIVGCVDHSDSPWFCGPYFFEIDNPQVLPFRPCKGALGFFRPSFAPSFAKAAEGGQAMEGRP